MENFEKVEMLTKKANVSFEDAKEAMEACNYDMLDAMIYLEKNGKVGTGKTASYTTTSGTDTSEEFEQAQRSYEDSCQRTSFGEVANKFGKWAANLIQKSVEIDFCVSRFGRDIVRLPLLALILAACFLFWIVVIALVVGLFCNCKYYFQGSEKVTESLNQICDKAAEACEELKSEFQSK